MSSELRTFANGAAVYMMPATPVRMAPAVIDCPFCNGEGEHMDVGCCWCDHKGRLNLASFGMSAEDARDLANTIHKDMAKLKERA